MIYFRIVNGESLLKNSHVPRSIFIAMIEFEQLVKSK